MPRVNTVQKARKDYPDSGISKGDTYYWWKFPYGSVIRSLTYPKRSQLTKLPYKSQAYDIEDSLLALEDPEDLDTILDNIEALKDEAQDALDSMPEHLQETSTSGQTLQEYVDALEAWYNDLDSIDVDIDQELVDEDETHSKYRIEEILEEAKSYGSPL